MVISPIPAFNDNYIWLLRGSGNQAVVVDPGDALPVIEMLDKEGLGLEAILVTHKHGDHVGGIERLKRVYPNLLVYGPAGEPIPAIDRRLRGGDRVSLPGVGVEFEILDVPGHTEGHIAYYGAGAMFCGDTLFAAGCGRVFSGTHQQLHESLTRIAALPGETLVYCAHEYTLDNLGFASWVEPDNPDIAQRTLETESLRRGDIPSVPSRLEVELRTNPFLRSGVPAVVAAAERYAGHQLGSPAEIFTAIRTWKDREYD
ncbi:MAG: hydroxyacylglutathione hydrolase [Gammaproteobacteria bacterium]|nr:hydroxyacylglutathione hydrolase [Gammaproteobacteria bacterium]